MGSIPICRRRVLLVAFALAENVEPVMKLIEKYSNVLMGFADACLVRMTETLDDPFILTSAMTHDGRNVRMLTLIDEYTRECLAIRVARRLGSYEVIEALADVMLWRGIPENATRGRNS